MHHNEHRDFPIETTPKESRGEVFCRIWADSAPPQWQWPGDESFEQWFSLAIPAIFKTIKRLQAERDLSIQSKEENFRLQNAYSKLNDEISQILGKALGYPWFVDDKKNFPDATEEHGVCVGEHVAESLASEAAGKIRELESINNDLLRLTTKLIKLCEKYESRVKF